MLRRHDDVAGGIGGGDTGEDTPVDDEEIVGAVDLGVEVHDGLAALGAAVVGADLGGADPVVCAAVGGGYYHLFGRGGLVYDV